MAKGWGICRLGCVRDRDAAAGVGGTEREEAGGRVAETDEDEEGWYHADLVGLRAVGADGTAYGRIAAVQNFGAGDLLEIAPEGGGETVLMAFTDENVPEVDIEGGRIVIDPPLGTFGEEAGEDGSEAGAGDD